MVKNPGKEKNCNDNETTNNNTKHCSLNIMPTTANPGACNIKRVL